MRTAVIASQVGSASGQIHEHRDRDIVEVLARKGIKLARRTVAKYRGELDLGSSFGRKRG